jgi:hypothetical protein
VSKEHTHAHTHICIYIHIYAPAINNIFAWYTFERTDHNMCMQRLLLESAAGVGVGVGVGVRG